RSRSIRKKNELYSFFFLILLSFGFELVRSELSRRSADRGVASVGRSSGGASDADRDNERVGWPTREAEIQVPQPIHISCG
ncbi:MAG: hypothetical protein Q8N88_03330, partial [Nanoarchaeota archaeon]|nr:hypothetical protein [Nanoarchaeota archaeon]